jgi:hypothetical protein
MNFCKSENAFSKIKYAFPKIENPFPKIKTNLKIEIKLILET